MIKQRLPALVLSLLVVLAPLGAFGAQMDVRTGRDGPTGAEMVVDGIVTRPLGLAGTVVGTAAWIVTLPFSLLGGNAGVAADHLIVRPAEYTFRRPLGEM